MKQQFFDSRVVRIHPQADRVVEEAFKRQNRLGNFLALLLASALFVLVIWVNQERTENMMSHLCILGLLFIYLACEAGKISGVGRHGLYLPDINFWKIPKMDFSSVVQELNEIGRLLGLPPDKIFDLEFRELETLAEEHLRRQAVQHLLLEEELGNEHLKTEKMKAVRKELIANNRQRLVDEYEKFVGARLIIRRDKGVAYFICLAKTTQLASN